MGGGGFMFVRCFFFLVVDNVEECVVGMVECNDFVFFRSICNGF